MKNQEEVADVQSVITPGYVSESLQRSNKQVRAERGEAIAEDLETVFKRGVEDVLQKIKRKKRDRLNMYDFSPSTSYSLVLKADVDAAEIYEKDRALTAEIRELVNEFIEMGERYAFLFGKSLNLSLE